MTQHRFDFGPPFRLDFIEQVKREILSTIPVHEIEKREYFEGSMESLVDYAIIKKHQERNFSLNVAFFDPNFNASNPDQRQLWSKENIWVKMKVNGGLGLVFRNRYMASQFGVARVDWKRRSFRVVKVVAAKALFKGGEQLLITTATPQGQVSAKRLSIAEKGTTKDVKQASLDRAEGRLHQVTYDLEEMCNLLAKMTMDEFARICYSGEIDELASHVFEALDVGGHRTIGEDQFLHFWLSLLRHDPNGAIHLYNSAAMGSPINMEQFKPLFREVMRRLVEKL